MMTTKKVQPGDKLKIPAAAYNSFVDAAEAHNANTFNHAPGKDQPGDNLILVKNNSGSDAVTGGVLGVDGPIFGPDDNLTEFKYNFALKGIVATTAAHEGKFMVIAEPIVAGKIGRAYLSGICPALLTIVDADHEYADIVDDVLKTADSGLCQILWMESGTGAGKWAMVRFGTISAAEGTCVTPKTLYSTYEGSETEQSDTWDITNQGANDGVKVYLTTRVVYNDTGTEVLLGFYREFKYDSTGRLVAISAETPYTIDTPGECP